MLGPVLAMLATACGNREVGTAAPASRPIGPAEVVVQVMVAGGFLPVSAAVTAVPIATVLGDGTVITTAPVLAIYPGPAITPLQSVRAPAATVDQLVTRAAELGLLRSPLDFGQPPVADAPDTTVTIVAGGAVHRHVANALGLEGGAGGVPAPAAANRRALTVFVEAVNGLPPGSAVWSPPAIAVHTLGDYQPDPQLAQPSQRWPLATPPAMTAGAAAPCMLVEGEEVAVLLEALSRANSLTPWVVGGREMSLAFRPVVPGQPGCLPG